MTKRTIILALAGAAFVVAPGFAADMPVKAPPMAAAAPLYDWSGLYAGFSGGWTGGGRNGVGPPSGVVVSSDGLRGGIVGGVYGTSWQFDRWVIGTISDLSWADADSTILGCGGSFTCNDKLRWLSTTRGRVGYAAGPTGNWLLYGTGGYAWGSIRRHDVDLLGGTSITETKTNSGWTWGAGAQVGLTPQWALGLEWLRVDLDHSKVFPGNGLFADEKIKDRFNVFRVMLTYRFGDPFGKAPVVAKY